MKINNKILAVTTLALVLVMSGFAHAQTSGTSTGEAKKTRAEQAMEKRNSDAKAKGDKLISDRIDSLNKLTEKISGLRNISDADKTTLGTMISTSINDLKDTQTKLDSDTGTTTLKGDLNSITQGHRIYAVVIPQVNIIAAADRVQTIAKMMNDVGVKLQSRLAQGSSTPAEQATLADLSAKIADAVKQSNDAATEVASLVPDNGDKTVMAKNSAAIKDARAKLAVATKDLAAARKDISTLSKSLSKQDKAAKPKPMNSSSTTQSVQ